MSLNLYNNMNIVCKLKLRLTFCNYIRLCDIGFENKIMVVHSDSPDSKSLQSTALVSRKLGCYFPDENLNTN